MFKPLHMSTLLITVYQVQNTLWRHLYWAHVIYRGSDTRWCHVSQVCSPRSGTSDLPQPELGHPVKKSTCWLLGCRTFTSSCAPYPHPVHAGCLVPTLLCCGRHQCSPVLPPQWGQQRWPHRVQARHLALVYILCKRQVASAKCWIKSQWQGLHNAFLN